MEYKTLKVLLAALAVGVVGAFLKGAWKDAKAQAEEAANPPCRCAPDKNRWE